MSGLFPSQTDKHTSMSFKATDSNHHHPSSFSRPWRCSHSISRPLIPDTGSLQQPGSNSQAPTLFIHLAYHTRGWCDTETKLAKTPHYPSVGWSVAHTEISVICSFCEQVTSLLKKQTNKQK